ncbi:hypothetical protein [Phaeospirillum tilakii]|uniref:Uncharacterized protein n=1 Tax=Phaeospirillum tilakii TaxID=741673 RepID=A0ABW5CD34_9PROT
MALYRLTTTTEPCVVIRESDGACIPPDPANGDYAAYLAWVAAGGVPDPAPAAAANAALLAQLDALDAKSVRPLRAVLTATQAGTAPDPADLAKLAAIEAQAQSLRRQIDG